MLRRPLLSLVLAAALLLALAVPSAAAPRASVPHGLASLWGQAWAWLTSLLPHAEVTVRNVPPGPTPDAGCSIDPDGVRRCSAASRLPRPTPNAGCDIDPNGAPRCGVSVKNLPPGPTPSAGCDIDPDGRCLH